MAEQETSLSVGSRGEVVKELQKWLNQFTSASIKEDGRYGQKTSQAVANFQRESGLEEDGIAGVNTIESIISYEGEGNEEEENEETVQGAEEEVTPTAQEEPEEEEVTPEEEAEFEEPTQAPAAPEQDTTPEVTPEEEAEFAAPEGEDPTLSQQPQDTTVSQEPVPAGQVGDQQADPALQPEQPSPEDLATAARYASYANRPTPAPAPTPEPAPEVPPEIPQATQQIQQQTAGNYQKFHKPAQASTNPAVNTITPADFDHGMSPQANNSQPETQASTDPATNTITPEEVPLQGYSSRDQFRNDLSQSFLTLKNMINSNSKDGIQELQAQLANIQQRAQASGQDFPKLTKYLSDLQGHAQKWGATFESEQPTHRPILTEEEKSLRQKMRGFWSSLIGDDDDDEVDPDTAPQRKEIADTIRKNLKDEGEYLPRPRAIRDYIKPATQTAHNFDYKGNFQQGIGNSGIKWTGPSIKYLTYDHKEAITSGRGAEYIKRLELADPKTYLARLNKEINGKDASRASRAEEELRNYKKMKKWVETYTHKGKLLIDIDMYTKIYKEEESQIPFILENGKEYNYNGLDALFNPKGKIQEHIKYSNYFGTKRHGGGELIQRWEAAVEAWNEINSKIGNDATQEWQNLKDEEKRARYLQLRSKARLGINSEVNKAILQKSIEIGLISPREAQELRELTDWYQNDYVAKLDKEAAEEEEREDKAAASAAARPVEDHKLHQELVADLAKDVQAIPVSAQDDSLIAQGEDEEDPEFLELAKDHATRVVEFLTTTIEGIGWSEDNAPLDTDPNSKMYAGIGERINNFHANLKKYQESASTEDFAVLEKDFDDIVTLVDDYSTTT